MEGLPEISRGPRRARRREMMHRGAAQPHEDDEGSMSDMRLNLDAARHAALSSFSAVATGSLRQIGTRGFCSCFCVELALFLYPLLHRSHASSLTVSSHDLPSTSSNYTQPQLHLGCSTLPAFHYSILCIPSSHVAIRARVTHFSFLYSFLSISTIASSFLLLFQVIYSVLPVTPYFIEHGIDLVGPAERPAPHPADS